MARLELIELCKGFDAPVLDRVNLTVEEGEFFVIVGPSGIGKTTLLRCVAGLEALDAGRVIIGGKDMSRLPPYRRNVALTFESYALYPHLTVFENIASPLRARRLAKAEIHRRVTQTAKLLRIDPLLDRRPHEISGGQKQRTALGRTLVARPNVFLLDEPISHLDAKIRHELRRQFHTLEDLRRVGTIYVTHDYAEALSLGDRIGIMGAGGLVQIGTAHQVFRAPETIFVARHLGQPTINEMVCELRGEGDGLTVKVADKRLALPVAPAHQSGLKGGGAVTLGIRPQDIAVVENPAAVPDGRHMVEAKVELFEALGATGVLVAEIDDVSMTVLTAPDDDFEPGQPIRLTIDTAAFHYFCPETGRNLHL